MDIFNFAFRDAGKCFILSLRSQYFLIRLIRCLSTLLLTLSVFVIIWLFLFSFYTHPDLINCKTIQNIFNPHLDEITNWEFTGYYDSIRKDASNQLNQTINCSTTGFDLWSCLESYIYNSEPKKAVDIHKKNMNYFELTEYLNNHQKNAFSRNHLLSCVIHFKSIDKLFNCWLKFTCDYKVRV